MATIWLDVKQQYNQGHIGLKYAYLLILFACCFTSRNMDNISIIHGIMEYYYRPSSISFNILVYKLS